MAAFHPSTAALMAPPGHANVLARPARRFAQMYTAAASDGPSVLSTGLAPPTALGAYLALESEMTFSALFDVWQTAPNGGWSDGVALGGLAWQVTLAQNFDGRLECFYTAPDEGLHHNWQTAPNNGWAGEQILASSIFQPAVGRNQDGRLELFYIRLDGTLCHNWQSLPGGPDWNGEVTFEGVTAVQVAIGVNQNECLEVVFTDLNKKLWHMTQIVVNGNWTPPSQISQVGPIFINTNEISPSTTCLCIEKNIDDRLELFYLINSGSFARISQTVPNGPWGQEKVFAGNSASQIAAARNEDGRLEIFYCGKNFDLYHNWQNTAGEHSWNGEVRFAENSAYHVAVGTNADRRLEIFYVGTNGLIYHNWQVRPNGPWAGETKLVDNVVVDSGTSLAVNSNADGRLEVLYISGR
jgi:hypothetical protein